VYWLGVRQNRGLRVGGLKQASLSAQQQSIARTGYGQVKASADVQSLQLLVAQLLATPLAMAIRHHAKSARAALPPAASQGTVTEPCLAGRIVG